MITCQHWGSAFALLDLEGQGGVAGKLIIALPCLIMWLRGALSIPSTLNPNPKHTY